MGHLESVVYRSGNAWSWVVWRVSPGGVKTLADVFSCGTAWTEALARKYAGDTLLRLQR